MPTDGPSTNDPLLVVLDWYVDPKVKAFVRERAWRHWRGNARHESQGDDLNSSCAVVEAVAIRLGTYARDAGPSKGDSGRAEDAVENLREMLQWPVSRLLRVRPAIKRAATRISVERACTCEERPAWLVGAVARVGAALDSAGLLRAKAECGKARRRARRPSERERARAEARLAERRADAVRLALRVGVREAARQLHMASSTLGDWVVAERAGGRADKNVYRKDDPGEDETP